MREVTPVKYQKSVDGKFVSSKQAWLEPNWGGYPQPSRHVITKEWRQRGTMQW